MITRFAHASFAILDSFFRAIANTGHAMRTICPPDRFILIQTDVIQWAQLHTFSAADTGITYRKSICLDDFLVENGIYRAAHKAVIQIISRCEKFHPITDTVDAGCIRQRQFAGVFPHHQCGYEQPPDLL